MNDKYYEQAAACVKDRVLPAQMELYGILEEHQGQGYATEAVGAAVIWALKQSDVVRVEADTEPDNRASRRVLEKCGFLPTGTFGEEGPRFFKTACEQKNVGK